MKFLILTESFVYFPGGAEYHIYRIAKELHRRGYDIIIRHSYKNPIKPGLGGAQFLIKKIPWSFRAYVLAHYSKKWKERYAHQLTSQEINSAPAEIERMFDQIIEEDGKPDFVISHSWFAHVFYKAIRKHNLRLIGVSHNGKVQGYDYTLFNSMYSMNRATDATQGQVLYPLCNIPKVGFGAKPQFDVGIVKGISHKGPRLFYKLAENLPDKRFVMLRGEFDWADIVLEKGPENVTFLKPLPSIVDFFKQIKICIHPATYEDFGMAALEAQYAGVPVISTNVMGLKEAVGSGGIMLPHQIHQKTWHSAEVEEWKKTIERLLSDEGFYQAQQEKGYEHAKKMTRVTMNQYDQFLRKCNEWLAKKNY